MDNNLGNLKIKQFIKDYFSRINIEIIEVPETGGLLARKAGEILLYFSFDETANVLCVQHMRSLQAAMIVEHKEEILEIINEINSFQNLLSCSVSDNTYTLKCCFFGPYVFETFDNFYKYFLSGLNLIETKYFEKITSLLDISKRVRY